MISVEVKIVGRSPLQQGAPMFSQKTSEESHEAFDQRCFMERGHWTKDGNMFIPAIALKNSIVYGAKYRPMKIQGGGGKQYGPKFVAGFQVIEDMVLPEVNRDNIRMLRLYVPADGKAKSKGPRVWRHFPVADEWWGIMRARILDEQITREIFERALTMAGMFDGMGVFRPSSGGNFGWYGWEDLKWSQVML
jgi:hypothetical protein